jgi:uncharacterized protein (UPF0261 family)
MSKPKVLLIVTQDTKEQEARFLRRELEEAGCSVIHLDASVRRTVGGAEISPEQIAAAAGTTMEQVRALGHEGKCLDVMTTGALKVALETYEREKFSGVLSVGGAMGTTLGTAVMRALPYGLPKLMVSTMASGYTAAFVGVKDIAMLNAVTDISGLNSISREIYRNAARAVAGMAHAYKPTVREEKPLVLAGTLGTTERCVARVRKELEAQGAEVMVFHTSGTGGRTLDSIAAERDVAAVVELSLVEINDFLHGGLCSAGPDRAKAAVARGIPVIFAPGNIDFIIGGPIDQARVQFPGRRYHVHNPALTAVRTGMPELQAVADYVAALARGAKGPVKFFVPLRGFSHHDSPEGHIHEPSLPPLFAEYVRKTMPGNVEVCSFECHINDPEFADAIVTEVRQWLR